MRTLRLSISFAFIFSSFLSIAADATIESNGNWDTASNWNGNNIGNNNETVDFDNNIGEVIIRSGFSYTIFSTDMKNGNELTINGTLDVGDAGNAADLSVGNTGIINVAAGATLIIWGNLNPGNSLTLNVEGTLIVKGDINMGNDATLVIGGDVQVDGNFNAGNNADVTINEGGNLDVEGEYDVGNGSTMQGQGSASGEPCSGPAEFCTNSPLPVVLSYFKAEKKAKQVTLTWETSSEKNNDYFLVERSSNGNEFDPIAKIKGAGTTHIPQTYYFEDRIIFSKIAYYRLKQVDFDGASEYSKKLSIQLHSELNDQIRIYPAVLHNENLSVEVQRETEIKSMKVIDLLGKQYPVVNRTESRHYIELNTINLPKGIYLLVVETPSASFQNRFIVR